MNNYEVTIWLMLPHQGSIEKPKTKRVVFKVEAEDETKAYLEAQKLDTSYLSVWNYKVEKL